ncbi:hypothetical protein F0562_023599 [Nyssa sinensis]|uniref:non-specific serine/threonine protein kinase n=1 Tax=Nyssa sinensis TaxID=561372 RepID=A0A5J5BHX9_9ASTE|nr:hypothetical protein F0562_023599 [Nyssa sinensis]
MWWSCWDMQVGTTTSIWYMNMFRMDQLSDHLHDPLLKGHQPLSWTVRAHIALDSARGIEYIHDHTKARYVHRDIKTSNILLDHGLRAKVADFGLAKLVERSNEEDFISTCVVGTPGYLPPDYNHEPNKMKSLVSVMYAIFCEEDSETALESNIDCNLKGSYPTEEAYKMAELARWCLSEDPINRPEMQEIVTALAQILMSSIEWEASLGGKSQVFSGLFNGR